MPFSSFRGGAFREWSWTTRRFVLRLTVWCLRRGALSNEISLEWWPRMSEPYLVLCLERSRKRASWWKSNQRGYTERVDEAGRYSEFEAFEIARGGFGGDVPVPLSAAVLYESAL